MNTQELDSNYLFNKRFVIELSENELANVEGGTSPACFLAFAGGIVLGYNLAKIAREVIG